MIWKNFIKNDIAIIQLFGESQRLIQTIQNPLHMLYNQKQEYLMMILEMDIPPFTSYLG